MIFDDAVAHIVKLYTGGLRQTIYMSGPPGCGKSAAAQEAASQIAEHLSLPLVNYAYAKPEAEHFGFQPLPMTVVDPLDFGGLPAVLDMNDGLGPVARRLRFTDLIPQRGAGIVLYDDLPTAPPLTQAAAYRTIWERDGIGADWMIIATGNRAEDRAAVQSMPRPLVSKMGWIDFEPDLDNWLTHMAHNNGSVLVRAFVKDAPNNFVTFKAELPGPFACPRTWEALSDVCQVYEPALPPFEAIKGWVGEGPALAFYQFSTMANELVSTDQILANPDTAMTPTNPSALYVVTTALASQATANNLSDVCKYLYRLPPEFAIYAMKTARAVETGKIKKLGQDANKYRRLDQTAAFREFCVKYMDLLT